MMKPHGEAILPDDKRYFNYRHCRPKLITEGAFGRFKIMFRVLFHKCESNKESVKLYGLVCVKPHTLCIERDDLISRKFNLTSDHASNKRLSPEEMRDIFALRSTDQKTLK